MSISRYGARTQENPEVFIGNKVLEGRKLGHNHSLFVCRAYYYLSQLNLMDAVVDDEKRSFDAVTAQENDSQPDPEAVQEITLQRSN